MNTNRNKRHYITPELEFISNVCEEPWLYDATIEQGKGDGDELDVDAKRSDYNIFDDSDFQNFEYTI